VTVVQSEGALLASHRPWNFGLGLGRSVSFYSGFSEDYAAIYRTQPNIRLCVRFLARNMAQLNIKGFRRVSATDRQELDGGHALTRCLQSPNPYVTRYRWIDGLVHDLKIYDTYLGLKMRNTQTGALRLFRIPPQLAEPIGDSWIEPEGFRILGSKAQPTWPREAFVYIRGHNPEDARIGLSPLESVRRLLAEEKAAGEWREQFWRNGARMSGVLTRPNDAPKWSDKARDRFLADWRSLHVSDGSEAGGTAILEEGMTWQEAAFSPKDAEYLGARKLAREEAAAQYFIPPAFVGILEHANFSNMKEQHIGLYQDTLGPDLTMIQEELELQLVPEFADVADVYLEFNLAEKLKGSFEEEATVLQTAVGAPWMTRNEARARRNLPTIEGGDLLVTPLNVLVGGQASPRDTAPALAGRLAGRKSVAELPSAVQGWHAKHLEVLGDFFTRQSSSVRARLGAGQSVETAWDDERWNTELTTDLSALALTMAEEVGTDVALSWGGTYDGALAEAWLLENARIAAEQINATTKAAIEDVVPSSSTGTASRGAKAEGDDQEEDPLDIVAGIFAIAESSRAEQIATSRVTSVGNFARQEGATQAGVSQKVWVVNSSNSRHPGMDGETVAIGETFSNGGLWPGDPSLPDDDRAGCTCSLEFAQ
jgi:HK97 family phage portal protein